MLPDKRESSDDCVGPGKASRVSLFITGTDTGVGKTHIAVQLLRLLRAFGTRCAGMKPICHDDRRGHGRLCFNPLAVALHFGVDNSVFARSPVKCAM
jgi:nucleoside-triphosphatase THEP1